MAFSNVVLSTIGVLSILMGWVAHESSHYVFGRLFGGKPFFTRRVLGLPTRVDFENPREMRDWQTKLTGGIVVIFPVGFAFFLGVFSTLTVLGMQSMTVHFIVAALFFAGGSGVSWLDLLAMYSPQKWKNYTSGNSIQRSNIK